MKEKHESVPRSETTHNGRKSIDLGHEILEEHQLSIRQDRKKAAGPEGHKCTPGVAVSTTCHLRSAGEDIHKTKKPAAE